MTPELAYFLKINIAIALFYAFYRLFFSKDTFFHWRRTTLLCFFAISLFYPLLNLQEWIRENEPMVAMADLYATMLLPETVIATPQEAAGTDWQEMIPSLLHITYWSGVLLLAIRFMIQLGCIIRLHFICSTTIIRGTRLHILKRKAGPFSFFRWIFVHPQSHTEAEISEIITHEETHAHQYHSADVLLSEIICIGCWFNPFCWLMKREVRGNLEYLADHRVLETGHDSKSYQYHLLGLAHHKAAANLSNSFNVLPLKNRIKMMNKRRTKEIGRTKYMMFLPLAALLMMISNIEMVARTTTKFAQEVIEQVNVQVIASPATTATPQVSTEEIQTATPPQDKKGVWKENTRTQDESVPDSVIFQVVEEMPDFPGGSKGLKEYLEKNVKYPAEAYTAKQEGRVIVSFVVKKDGSIANIQVIRSISPLLDKEAERVIAAMPKWKPGMQRGKAVNVMFTVPVSFQLTPAAMPKAEEIKESDLSEVVVVALADKSKNTSDEVHTNAGDKDVVFKVVEVMPKFPGGTAGLMQYLAKNIKYPVVSQKNKEQGRVIINMVIDKNGGLSNIRVLRSISPSLDAEAIRVVSNMPKWEPGQQRGQAVSVEYTLPIMFKLQ